MAERHTIEVGNGQLFRSFPHTVNGVLSSSAEVFHL